MANFLKKRWVMVLVSVLIVAAAVSLSLYRDSLTRMLDKAEYSDLSNAFKESAEEGAFTSQSSLKEFITEWADSIGLEYRIDKSGNIIFSKDATDRKKKISPTVVCVSYNYETAKENSRLLAGAAMIAKADIASGSRAVIFVNDEQNNGDGYKHLSKKFFKRKAKVIYLDYGSSAYISNSSFGKKNSVINIKAGRYEPECDTAVKVHISGIDTGIIGTGISKHPDPVSALGTLLARLKSKSAVFQLADFEVGTNGNMYPTSMDATIMLNSYAVSSFTKYIDKRIKAWEKAYGKDYENLTYTYEVIDDPELLPTESYSRKATARLANVLYTLQSGLYKYEENDDIPEGREAGDVCGINAVTGLHAEEGYICVDLMTQAYDDNYMDRIMNDNTASAELFDCSLSETSSIPRFLNEKDSLRRTLISTYYKLNDSSSTGGTLKSDYDNYFTPCSYLSAKNENADVIHLRLNPDNSSSMINTIIYYIAYKGNNFLL